MLLRSSDAPPAESGPPEVLRESDGRGEPRESDAVGEPRAKGVRAVRGELRDRGVMGELRSEEMGELRASDEM